MRLCDSFGESQQRDKSTGTSTRGGKGRGRRRAGLVVLHHRSSLWGTNESCSRPAYRICPTNATSRRAIVGIESGRAAEERRPTPRSVAARPSSSRSVVVGVAAGDGYDPPKPENRPRAVLGRRRRRPRRKRSRDVSRRNAAARSVGRSTGSRADVLQSFRSSEDSSPASPT